MTANHQRPTMLPVHDNRVYLRDPVSLSVLRGRLTSLKWHQIKAVSEAQRNHSASILSGMWLNLSCEYLTHDKAYRWIGTAEQVANCRRKYPVAAKLKMVRSAAMPVFNSYH